MGEELECKLDGKNKYSSLAIIVLTTDAQNSNKKTAKERQKQNKKSGKTDREIMIGHDPDVLAKLLFPDRRFTPSQQPFMKITVLQQKEKWCLAVALNIVYL